MRGFGKALLYCALVAAVQCQAEFHPADTNHDHRINLAELTHYASAYTAGESWPTAPTAIPADFLEQAKYIWRNGESYTQLTGAPLPQAWVPAPADGTVFVAAADVNPEPLDFVEIFGLPSDATNLFAEVQIPGQKQIFYTLMRQPAPDRWELLTPLRPDSADGGGAVSITIRNADNFYPLGTLNLAPLPAAPGTAAGVATDLAGINDLIGSLTGGPLSNYYDTPVDSIPEDLRPYVLLDQVVRDPGNPNNLSNVLAGTAPALQNVSYNADQIDRIWAKLGVRSYLADINAAFAGAPSTAGLPVVLANSRPVLNGGPTTLDARVPVSTGVLRIQDLNTLSHWMKKQCEAESATASGTARADFLQDSGYAISAVGLLGPVGAAFSLGAGATLFALQTYNQGLANLLPSDAVFELLVSKPFFYEDYCETGDWEAYVHATSKGWSLDKTLVTGAFTAFSGAGAVRGLQKVAAGSEALGAYATEVVDYGEATAGVALGKFFPGDTSVITISPSHWDNIPVSDEDIDTRVKVEVVGTAIKLSTQSKRSYEPNEVGEAGLKVQTVDGLLGCEAPQGKTVLVEVRDNKVSLSPNGGPVTPDQVIEFTAIVTDAHDKSLAFSVSAGTIQQTNLDATTGVHTMTWKAPPKDQFPTSDITITATSLARSCLRQGVIRKRVATFTPENPQLYLTPSVSCLQTGASQTFAVIDAKMGPVPPVTWEWSGPGMLTTDGTTATYTASGGDGIVTVRATTQGTDPQVLEQTFSVGSCYGVSVAFVFAPQTGTSHAFVPNFIITDVQSASDPSTTEGYAADGQVNLTQLGNGHAIGTLAGVGTTFKFPSEYYTNPGSFDDGSRTFSTSADGVDYELTVQPSLGLAASGPDNSSVEYVSANQIKVHLISGSSVLGDWPGANPQIASVHWDFSDGGAADGEEVYHTFEIGPAFDQNVTITATDNFGHTAQYTQQLRFTRFNLDFDLTYEPGNQSSCTTYVSGLPLPGDGACEATLQVFGPRPYTSTRAFVTGAPFPDSSSRYDYNLNF